MAPSRKQSNGRSPLVNQQRQITSFFSKGSPPSPSLPKKETPKYKPNPSPSPATPSPLQSKPKKTLLVIGQTPSVSPSTSPATPATAVKSYGKEVVQKRIRVYWPLDQSWYEGCVKSYNEDSGKHLVQYDDFEEELLELGKEKIEWVQETTTKFRRLRRGVMGIRKMVVEDEEEDNAGGSGDDDSDDEDWGKNVDKGISEEEGEEIDLEEEEEIAEGDKKGKKSEMSKPRKRKASGGDNLDSVKKGKSSGNVLGTEKIKEGM